MANFLKNLFDKKPKVEKFDVSRRFELLTRVGQGSMSKVWRARDNMTGRMLAVKVLDKMKTDRFESRFLGLKKPSEGEIAASLQHPNIVHTIEYGTTINDEQFIVMDFVEGLSLSYLVEVQNEQMQDNCLNYVIQLGEALDYLHRQNWIHRDLCPRNVMIDPDNIVKLIDFGLVVPNIPDFQRPGNRTGTANYMAPELIKRQRTDQRIDIFSFAVTAYEMYAKRLPWDVVDQATLETVLQHINKPPTPIIEAAPHIDPRVADVIMRGLQSNPDDRWQTMSELLIPLRKAHEEIEAKKRLARKLKAASARAKDAKSNDKSAAVAAAAQKSKADDEFFEQVIRDERAKKKNKSKSKPKAGASSKTIDNAAMVQKQEPHSNKSSELNPQVLEAVKPIMSPPRAIPEIAEPDIAVDDEFDGIEVEEEGHKLDAVGRPDESFDEFDGIEIDGELPVEVNKHGTYRDAVSITAALLVDEVAGIPPSIKPVQAILDEDDELVLRLPDDD